MLDRNNGINIRADSVLMIDDRNVLMGLASIVNGCQTTKCIVDFADDEAFVSVKIVQASDSWDVAKAANYQNRVEQIVLDLARYVRPQVVARAATRLGIGVKTKVESVSEALSSIYQDQVRYEQVYYLFMGLFSNSPTNIISKAYVNLKDQILIDFINNDPHGYKTFEILLKLSLCIDSAKESMENIYSDNSYKSLFERFWKEDKPDYRAFMAILAICGCLRKNLYEDAQVYNSVSLFLKEIDLAIDSEKNKILRYYKYAFEALALYLNVQSESRGDSQKLDLFEDVRRAKFGTLYRHVCMIADGREASTL
jgi:hypothetical protein